MEVTDAIEEARETRGVIVPDLYADGNVWGGEVDLDTPVLNALIIAAPTLMARGRTSLRSDRP